VASIRLSAWNKNRVISHLRDKWPTQTLRLRLGVFDNCSYARSFILAGKVPVSPNLIPPPPTACAIEADYLQAGHSAAYSETRATRLVHDQAPIRGPSLRAGWEEQRD
jgi:hypothetical protein